MWGPQRPKFWILAEDFGFWGFWILDLGDFGFWILGILDFGVWGFWILDLGDFGFWILGPKSKIQNPPSKIQNPNFFGRFLGFWILDRYVANLYVASNFGDFGFWGFWIWGIWGFGFGDFGFWILDLGDFGFWGFWISDFGDFGFWGFWILDFGPLCSKSLCAAPNAPNLGDFGFWGFWILGILDFGVWGFWILDFVTNFGFYIRRRRLCTPNRVGGFKNGICSFGFLWKEDMAVGKSEKWRWRPLLTKVGSFWLLLTGGVEWKLDLWCSILCRLRNSKEF